MQWRVVRLVMMVLGATVAASANANDWGDLAVVSGTLGNNSNRLCLGAPDSMRPADIGCPSYAPSLSTAGHVSITGNVSANKFIGDGSGLTNLSVSGDRIVSDTHAVIVHEGTGYVSLTSAGTTWGYLSGGWSYLANLFTNSVSSSLVSATNVSATYVDATRNGTVSGTYGYFHYISGTNIHGTFTGDGSGLTGIGQGDRIVSGTAPFTQMVAISDTRYISITQGGANTAYFHPGLGLVTLGVSTTGPISATHGYFGGFANTERGLTVRSINGANTHIPYSNGQVYLTGDRSAGATGTGDIILRSHDGTANTNHVTVKGDSGYVGIGTALPNATLHVSGTISASNAIQVGTSALTCGAGIPGAMRYSSGNMQFCNGSAWTTLGSAGAATAASSTGAIQFNSANALAGDTTNLFWNDTNNRLGVGTSTPSTTLMVQGTQPGPTAGYSQLFINTPDNNDGTGLALRTTETGTERVWAIMAGTGGGSPNHNLRFYDVTALAERMTLTTGGKLGIGVTAPTATLQVSGTAIITSNTEVSGTLKVAGTGSEACNAGTYGTIRYNAAIEAFQMCRP